MTQAWSVDMPSHQLNTVFNRAVFDEAFCADLLKNLAGTLEQAQVPPEEIAKLLRLEPETLEQLAQYIAAQP